MNNSRPPSRGGPPSSGRRPPSRGDRPAYGTSAQGPRTGGSGRTRPTAGGSKPDYRTRGASEPRSDQRSRGPAGEPRSEYRSRGDGAEPRSEYRSRGPASGDSRPSGPRSRPGDGSARSTGYGRTGPGSRDGSGPDRPASHGRTGPPSGSRQAPSRGRPPGRAESTPDPRPTPAPTAYAGSSETIQGAASSGISRPAANRPAASSPRTPPKPGGSAVRKPPAPRKVPQARPAASKRPRASSEVPPRKRATANTDPAPEGTRIQKVLSEAGIASRRAAEDMIRQGRVIVNGAFADLGQRIDAAVDRVEVDGLRVQLDPAKQYFLLNKPEGVITTTKDPEGRTTVLDVIGIHERVFPVGRLDIATEGLLLLTNDGELTHRLTHPSFEVTKTYVAEVAGTIGKGVMRKLTVTGVELGEKELFKADAVRVLGSRKGPGGNRAVVELEVHEGPKHLVRRVMEAVDRPVLRLVRTGMGPLKLGRMTVGTYRHLTQAEVDALYREVGL